MSPELRQRSLWLLIAIVVGSVVAPGVHRVQHAEAWLNESEARRQAAHAHAHPGVTLCDNTTSSPPAFQDSPCVLCSGTLIWAVLDHEQPFPIRRARMHADGREGLAPHFALAALFIRGPPHLA